MAAPVGSIVSHLADLLRLAQLRWRVDLSLPQLAQAAGINSKTAYALSTGGGERLHLEPIRRVCAYLGCQAGDLLVYVPPGAAPPAPPIDPQRLIWDEPPARDQIERVQLTLTLPATLTGPDSAERRALRTRLAALTGAHRHTIAALQPGRDHIDRSILAALCLLQQQTVSDVLQVSFDSVDAATPSPTQEAR